METLFRFELPADPTALEALQTTIRWTGAIRHDHPAVKGWSLSSDKPSDIEALRGHLVESGTAYTEQVVDLPALLFGGAVLSRVRTMQAAGLCPRGGEIVDCTIGLCSCGECPTPRPGWVAK